MNRSIRSLQFVLITFAAGLPLVALGTSRTRSAIYDTTGWIPLSIAVLVVFASGRNAAVRAFTRRR